MRAPQGWSLEVRAQRELRGQSCPIGSVQLSREAGSKAARAGLGSIPYKVDACKGLKVEDPKLGSLACARQEWAAGAGVVHCPRGTLQPSLCYQQCTSWEILGSGF